MVKAPKIKKPFISMTGMGRADFKNNDIILEISIKTVNHRSIDIKTHLPMELISCEQEIIAILSDEIKRGRVDIYVALKRIKTSTPNFVVNASRITAVIDALNLIKKEHKLSGELTLSDVLRIPGVLCEEASNEDQLRDTLLSTLKDALKDLLASRIREGNLLTKSLQSLLDEVFLAFSQIKKDIKKDVLLHYARFKSRVDELFKDIKIDQDRIYQESALLVERSDFTEEIDRLGAHLEHFQTICQDSGIKGRKLDFLCQEMLRESTTLLSKASNHSIMMMAINLKSDIEKIREQIQNIE